MEKRLLRAAIHVLVGPTMRGVPGARWLLQKVANRNVLLETGYVVRTSITIHRPSA